MCWPRCRMPLPRLHSIIRRCNSTSRAMGELPADMPRQAEHGALGDSAGAGRPSSPSAFSTRYARPLAEPGARGEATAQGRRTAAGRDYAASAAARRHRSRNPRRRPPKPHPPSANDACTTRRPSARPRCRAGETPIGARFRGTSWVEIKDAKGAIVLSTIGYPGASQAVGERAPARSGARQRARS